MVADSGDRHARPGPCGSGSHMGIKNTADARNVNKYSEEARISVAGTDFKAASLQNAIWGGFGGVRD